MSKPTQTLNPKQTPNPKNTSSQPQTSSFQNVFTPTFLFTSICIFIGGLIGLQFLDRLFAGSKNLNAIRMFGLTVIINIIILVFLIMSFSKVNFTQGPTGPTGNKGERGREGKPGGLEICGKKYQTVEEKKMYEKIQAELNMKNPLINDD
jgi:hypothetical protein